MSHRRGTEYAEKKILFACPEEFPGQAKRLFWRIGLSPILQKKSTLSDLRVSAVKNRFLWRRPSLK
jgi:hypothetical protein